MRHDKALWTLLGALCLANPALADDPYVVVVDGQATIEAAPDLAYLSMGVEARAPGVQAAAASVAERVERVLALTRGLGIPDRHVSTAAASVRPDFDYRGNNRPDGPRLIGYVVRRQITIRLDDLDLIGRVTEGALEAGVNSLSDAVFDTTRRAELEREAMGRAVADARSRAEAIAAADGARAGKARRLTAMRGGGPRPQMMMREAAAMAADQAVETYQTADLRIEARVQAEFELLTD
jgi:uncharacterized protein YggE